MTINCVGSLLGKGLGAHYDRPPGQGPIATRVRAAEGPQIASKQGAAGPRCDRTVASSPAPGWATGTNARCVRWSAARSASETSSHWRA